MVATKKPGGKGRGNGKSKKDANADNFDRGHGDGPRARQAANDQDKRGEGDNSKHFTADEIADQVGEFLELMDEVDATIAGNNRENSARNQPHRKRLTNAFRSLVKDGVVPSRELQTLQAERRLQRKLENIDHKLNDEQKETFASVKKALAGLAGTPLGDAAIAHAEAALAPRH